MRFKNKLFIFLILFFTGVLWFYTHMELHFPLNPFIDTEFTNGFSFDKFNQVNIGMNPQEVKSILGEPIGIFNFGYECWRYSTDGAAAPLDFSWYSYQVCFKDGVVESMPVTEFSD